MLNFEYLKNDRYQAILGIYQVVVVLNPNQLVARYDCFSAFQYIVVCRHTYFAMSDNGGLYQVIMLMYGKEASNRKQEIDRQHHTILNQRPKDKHYGNVHNRLRNPSHSFYMSKTHNRKIYSHMIK